MKGSALFYDIKRVIAKGKEFEDETFRSEDLFAGDPRSAIVYKHPEVDRNEIKLGVNCLVPAQIIPKSRTAIIDGPVTLPEALNRTMRGNPFDDEYSKANISRLSFGAKYIESVCESAKINPIATAVCFGLDVATVRRLNIDEYCKYVPSMFDARYKIVFSERGWHGCDAISHVIKCNDVFERYAKSKVPFARNQAKINIFYNLFGDRSFELAQKGVCIAEQDIEQKIFEIAELMIDLNVSRMTATRILHLAGAGEIDGENLVRRLIYKKDNENKKRFSGAEAPIDRCYMSANCEERFNLVVNSLTLNAIGGAYSASDFVLALITSVIVACDICHIDRRYCGQLFSRFEKANKKLFHRFVD